jgi:hypothetical protein
MVAPVFSSDGMYSASSRIRLRLLQRFFKLMDDFLDEFIFPAPVFKARQVQFEIVDLFLLGSNIFLFRCHDVPLCSEPAVLLAGRS